MALTTTRPPPRDPNKFPATQLFLLALVRVAEPVAILSILPYAYPFVLHFSNGSDSNENASFWAGVLISSFSLAEALSGMFWGALSDRLGRKPVLLMGCLGTIISLLAVGFSANFWMALFARFLGGALNGNQGVIQSMVGEIVVNPAHEPKAYAIMPFVWSVGAIIGPSIGGYFAEPVVHFPGVFAKGSIFDKFPYLLPNLICAGLMAISVIAGYFCLEETHPDMQPWSKSPTTQHKHPSPSFSGMPAQGNLQQSAAHLEHESYGTFNAVSEEAIDEEWDIEPNGATRPSSVHSGDSTEEKVFTRRVLMLTVALGIFTYHSMTYDTLFPVFAQDGRVPSGSELLSILSSSTATTTGSLTGGLGISVQQVGIIMSVNGIIALFVQAIIFPLMASWLGIWRTFLFTAIGHPLAYFLVPFLVYLPDRLLYPGIYGCLFVRNIFSILAYPVLLILIKEASPSPKCFGQINGLAASTGAFSRMVAAPIAGALYGVGIKMSLTAIAWWASSAVALIGTTQAFFINRKTRGRGHHVVGVAPCHFLPDEQREHRPSVVVHIKVHVDPDSGYSSADERTPLASRVPRG